MMIDDERIETELKKLWDEMPHSHSSIEIITSWEMFNPKLFSSKNKNCKKCGSLKALNQKVKKQ